MNSSPELALGGDSPALLGAPLRILHFSLGLGFALACVLNLAFGVAATGLATGLAAAMMLVGWRICASGRFELSAVVTFYTLSALLAPLAVVGHGTRDYALIALSAAVFAASVFLRPVAYWSLAGSVVAGVVALGIAEAQGWFRPRPVPHTGVREVLNLLLLLGAAAIGGRGLTVAMRSAFAREKALSGELIAMGKYYYATVLTG